VGMQTANNTGRFVGTRTKADRMRILSVVPDPIPSLIYKCLFKN